MTLEDLKKKIDEDTNNHRLLSRFEFKLANLERILKDSSTVSVNIISDNGFNEFEFHCPLDEVKSLLLAQNELIREQHKELVDKCGL